MTRTNKKPDDPLNRLTGSASHEGAHEIDPVVAGEALEADAAMAEADDAIAQEDAQTPDAQAAEATEATETPEATETTEDEDGADEAAENDDRQREDGWNEDGRERERPGDRTPVESAGRDRARFDRGTARRGDSAAGAGAPRTPVPEFSDAPTVAIGRASVAPPPMESPFAGSPFAGMGAGVARTEPEPPGSYDELLGDLGEPTKRSRAVSPPRGWDRTLRRFGQGALWTLPVAAVCLALSGMWGWPTVTAEPAGASPGTWLVITVLALAFGLVGVVGLTALLSTTPGRRPALVALVAVVAGSVLLGPMLGLIALGRSAATRMEQRIGTEATAELDARFFDHPIGRWLGLGGLMLLGLGWLAMGAAVLASRVLNRVDGYLLLCAVAIAAGGAYLSWQFLITVAGMVLLAAGLGLSVTALRIGPDGRAPTGS